MKIAIGAARGLAYLHEDSQPCVIHRDFKASNILLQNNFNPKVADFGLARLAPEGQGNYVSTRVMGTFGYVNFLQQLLSVGRRISQRPILCSWCQEYVLWQALFSLGFFTQIVVHR